MLPNQEVDRLSERTRAEKVRSLIWCAILILLSVIPGGLVMLAMPDPAGESDVRF
jgi:hypothetical protein